ncbi:hypothetical protein AB6A40_005359 [Gnathostoma spinigerum]|uniref:Tyrosine-protein kinase n=1 Tax=Gnathostoma spinigerum TaxID=75299 RepID=A0ABD6EF75_9BILA
MSEVPTAEKDDNDECKSLEKEPYYHGMLPREDLTFVLEEVGDFIIRMTETKRGEPWEAVISVRTTKEKDPQAFRHILLRRQKQADKTIQWQAIEPKQYPSIPALVEDYMKSKRPINPEVESSVLLRGVGKQSWEFLHEEITIKDLIGAGQFGEVRKGELKIDGKIMEVAIKSAKVPTDDTKLEGAKEKVKELMHEARLMRHFKHVNVVTAYGVAVRKQPLMIIIELVRGGSLWRTLTSHKGQISEQEKTVNMALGAARGLEYLHLKNCIHRDVAARNFLYTDEKVTKITDFGLSRKGPIYQMKKSMKVPMRWTAPESMVAFQYTFSTDIFAFSVFLWEVYSDGEEPYKGKTSLEVKRMISCGERMEQPEDCPDEIFEIIEKGWHQSPAKRGSMGEIVSAIEDFVDECDDVTQTTVQGDAGKSSRSRRKKKHHKHRKKHRKKKHRRSSRYSHRKEKKEKHASTVA